MKFLLFVLWFGGIACALSMQDAVLLALKANHTIKEQEFLLKESEANYKMHQSPFYPSLNATYETLKSNRYQGTDRNKKASGSVGGSVQYNLFNGLSDVFELKSAQSLLESQGYQLEAITEDVILLVKSAYIDVLRQAQNVKIKDQQRELLEEQRRQNAEFYRVGLIQKNDLLKVEVELNNTLQELLTYKSALKYALRNLERYTQIRIALEDLVEFNVTNLSLNFEELRQKMLSKRAELLYLEKLIESKDYAVQSVKGNFLPEVDVRGEYLRFGDDYALRGREGVYKDETSVNLSVNLNLFNGFNDRYSLESVRMDKLATNSQKMALLEDLELQLFAAFEDYNLAKNALEISKVALQQAEENYRISKNRYEQRIETTRDFLDAQSLLTQARSNVALSHYLIAESLAQLERITQSNLTQQSNP